MHEVGQGRVDHRLTDHEPPVKGLYRPTDHVLGGSTVKVIGRDSG
jgi:hypothetical protein